MHQATHITYGEGKVNILLDSTSLNEVASPEFRFADYSDVVTSCFTQKELDRISEGENADLVFSFVVSDKAEDESIQSGFDAALKEYEDEYGTLNEGIYIDVTASKNFTDGYDVEFSNTREEVDIQMDIPLYLVKEDREYFFLSNYMGEYVLVEDSSPDADVLTVKTNVISDGFLVFQDREEKITDNSGGGFHIKGQYVFVLATIILVMLWFMFDHLHKKQ
ncbi:hypothetical protein [Butyrivibrio sp. YAB3001]|uniref:hypothetical protein n=1 Tax=Butyrivibrio sp. YAB3001 TaxID=1520812 RepID=UPI0008F6556D|nr:hypothetical protein [Butyrivibrio sp. YAB3001]SFC41907.1 hypothetical protein SAMN02910398_02212 [Butyrivibrio sp. YAB3001]